MFIIFSESEFLTSLDYINNHDYHADAPTIVMTLMCIMNDMRSNLTRHFPKEPFNPENMLKDILEKLSTNKLPEKIIVWNSDIPFRLAIGNRLGETKPQ